MKPLPAPGSPGTPAGRKFSSVLPVPESPSSLRPKNQKRPPGGSLQRAYPWLLLASTALSATLCFLYLTKPVIVAEIFPEAPSEPSPPPLAAATPAENPPTGEIPASSLLPGNLLPGDRPAAPVSSVLPPAGTSPFEQTNLSVQHVLNAQIPSGDLCRIVLDVPVLYRSRQLRWTEADVATARDLLARLADYQEKSVLFRAEGASLLEDWNRLVARSIPAGDLRADSPSLPANQRDAAPASLPAGLDSGEAVQLEPAGK